MTTYHDVPRARLMELAHGAIKDAPPGAYVHFKFTCEQCGERCVLAETNTLREQGECFACGHKTTIDAGGFMLIVPVVPAPENGATA